MSPISKNDYLKLLQEYVDQQYDDAIDDYNIEEMEWMNEPEIKMKVIQANSNGTIDLTEVKADKIKDELFKCTNLKIGTFKIRINRYHGLPSNDGSLIVMNLEVWEEKKHTPNGHPCKIDFPLIFHKDTRFIGRNWVTKYFDKKSVAYNVPVETVIEIVRWMQAVTKLSAFL
jgi:hypothetical protein